MRRTKDDIKLSQDHALELFSSDAFLSVNKRLLKYAGPSVAIFLGNLIDKYKYFKHRGMDENDWFFQTHEWQKEATGLSEKNIRKCKKQLINAEILQTCQKGVPAKEWYKINVNKLIVCIEDISIYEKQEGLDLPKGEGLDLPKGEGLDLPKGEGLYKDTILKDIKVKDKSSCRVIPSLFDSFWKIYPRTQGSKGAALKSWLILCNRPINKRPTWRIIKTALLDQKETPKWKARVIPHPATWINQQRWIDNPEDMDIIDYNKLVSSSVPANGFPPYIRELAYNSDLLHKLVLPDDNALMPNMVKLVNWFDGKQKRPSNLNELDLNDDREHSTYCKWKDIIPDGQGFLERYVDWLVQSEWIDTINEGAFLPDSKIMKEYLRHTQSREQINLFTGEYL